MSWMTCVIVKQIQSNHQQKHAYFADETGGIASVADITDDLNFAEFAWKSLGLGYRYVHM